MCSVDFVFIINLVLNEHVIQHSQYWMYCGHAYHQRIGSTNNGLHEYDKREGSRGEHERVSEYGFGRKCVMTCDSELGYVWVKTTLAKRHD